MRPLRTSVAAALLFAAAMAQPARAAACSAEVLQQREVMHAALSDVARRGLRGTHHFSITFKTTARGVVLPAALLASYPQEMTIILQYQFERLKVAPERFAVTLWFKGVRTRIAVPFDAITLFVDPSVNVRLEPDPASIGQRCQRA